MPGERRTITHEERLIEIEPDPGLDETLCIVCRRPMGACQGGHTQEQIEQAMRAAELREAAKSPKWLDALRAAVRRLRLAP